MKCCCQLQRSMCTPRGVIGLQHTHLTTMSHTVHNRMLATAQHPPYCRVYDGFRLASSSSGQVQSEDLTRVLRNLCRETVRYRRAAVSHACISGTLILPTQNLNFSLSSPAFLFLARALSPPTHREPASSPTIACNVLSLPRCCCPRKSISLILTGKYMHVNAPPPCTTPHGPAPPHHGATHARARAHTHTPCSCLTLKLSES